jgi:hypothetical protein
VNTEADTCRKFVVPRLQTAGWEGAPHAINGQRTFTDNSTARRLLFMLLVLERESMIWTPSVGSIAIFCK